MIIYAIESFVGMYYYNERMRLMHCTLTDPAQTTFNSMLPNMAEVRSRATINSNEILYDDGMD